MLESKLRDIAVHVRKRPGLYFGGSGAPASTAMIVDAVRWLVRHSQDYRARTLSVHIDRQSGSDAIQISFDADPTSLYSSGVPRDALFNSAGETPLLLLVAAASSWLSIDASSAHLRRVSKVSSGWRVQTTNPRPLKSSRLKISFQPDAPAFGPTNDEEILRLAGILEDVAILTAGLSVRLTVSNPRVAFEWTYPEGLKSWLQRRDYSRFPLHAGVLSVVENSADLSIEAHFRFLHAGVSEIRSWVGGIPSQGGVHYEAIGDVFHQMLRDQPGGCRQVPFITNPDKGLLVWLPHCFIGAVKLAVPKPRFAGPTTDVLLGDEVKAFVQAAVGKSLPGQWAQARQQRF